MTVAGVRECLRARFDHPYRTFAPVCLAAALAKSISGHPYRTFAPRSFTLARAMSISGHRDRTFAPVCFTLARAKSISEHPFRSLCLHEHFRAPLSHFAPLQLFVIASVLGPVLVTSVCFTLARAKGISEHPFRTWCFQEHFRAPLSHFVIELLFCSGRDHFSYILGVI